MRRRRRRTLGSLNHAQGRRSTKGESVSGITVSIRNRNDRVLSAVFEAA